MALPVIPIFVAASALSGAIALARKLQVSPVIQDVEDALDTVDEGGSMRVIQDRDQINGSLRWKRVVRFGADGPGVEIDASALGRLRWRKV